MVKATLLLLQLIDLYFGNYYFVENYFQNIVLKYYLVLINNYVNVIHNDLQTYSFHSYSNYSQLSIYRSFHFGLKLRYIERLRYIEIFFINEFYSLIQSWFNKKTLVYNRDSVYQTSVY